MACPALDAQQLNRPAPGLFLPVFEWKGCQGHARKPHAERSRHGEHRTGEDVGEAEPLMPLERPKPLVWGAVKEAKRPAACIPDDRGRLAPLAGEGRGGVVRRVKFASPVESTTLFTNSKTDSARQILQTLPKAHRAVFSSSPALAYAFALESASCGLCAPLKPVSCGDACTLLPDKPVFRTLELHEPFRHGAHTRRAERAADLSAGRDLSRS